MSANLRNYTTAVFGLEHVIRMASSAAWANPSPCDGWSARQVAGHAIAVVSNVAARGGVGEQVDVFAAADTFLGDDPAATARAVRQRYLSAVDSEGALQRTIQSSLGAMTLDHFMSLMLADTLVHTWDVARALGVDDRLDPDLVDVVHASLIERDGEAMRAPGRYDSARAAADSANPQDRLISFTGRDPGWTSTS